MDKRRFNGGNKNAGRKPKADEIKLIEKLTPLDEIAFKMLEQGIEKGDFKYIQLYFKYRWGLPKETKDITLNQEQPIFSGINLDVIEVN